MLGHHVSTVAGEGGAVSEPPDRPRAPERDVGIGQNPDREEAG